MRYMCVRVRARLLCCLLCFCMFNILSCLLLWNLFYGVQCFHIFLHIYICIHHHCYELCKALRALGIERCIRCSLLLLLLLFILLFVSFTTSVHYKLIITLIKTVFSMYDVPLIPAFHTAGFAGLFNVNVRH